MRIMKGAINLIPRPTKNPLALELSTLSIFENDLEKRLGKDIGKGWTSSFKVERSDKIFKKDTFFEHGSSGRVNKAFKPMRTVLLVLGRFPFSPTVAGKGLSSPTFGYSFFTIQWAYFGITSIFLIYAFLMCTLGFANFFLEWEFPVKTDFHEEEKCMFKKNLVPFVLFWGCLVHVAIGNLTFLTNRKKVVDYLNNWNVVVDIINVDMPCSLKKFIIISGLWLCGFVGLFFTFFWFDVAPIARNASSLVANLILRPFIKGIHPFDELSPRTTFGILTLIYGIYGSRALLFLYLFKSRLLHHSFKVWNRRLREHIYKDCNDEDTFSEKIACEKLYRDHYILVRMVKQTDTVFGTMLQSYYAAQILNMCFELYYLARSQLFYSESSDVIVAGVLFAQTVSFFFTVSLDAAYVNEEAMKGFDVLRSRGLHADDSPSKKHLIYSLEMSFSQRIVLTGGKFFSVDRPFIVTVLGAVFTYFVIILQFGSQIYSHSEPGGDPQSNCSKISNNSAGGKL